MGDLITNAKEFAQEMEQYLELQRKADKVQAEADAKCKKLKAFLQDSNDNRKAAMPKNKFKAEDGTIIEWLPNAAALARSSGTSVIDVVRQLEEQDLSNYVLTTYDADGLKKAFPYNAKESATALETLGLYYKDPSYKLVIKKKSA